MVLAGFCVFGAEVASSRGLCAETEVPPTGQEKAAEFSAAFFTG